MKNLSHPTRFGVSLILINVHYFFIYIMIVAKLIIMINHIGRADEEEEGPIGKRKAFPFCPPKSLDITRRISSFMSSTLIHGRNTWGKSFLSFFLMTWLFLTLEKINKSRIVVIKFKGCVEQINGCKYTYPIKTIILQFIYFLFRIGSQAKRKFVNWLT